MTVAVRCEESILQAFEYLLNPTSSYLHMNASALHQYKYDV